jgi:hypothetical protein
MMTFQFYLQPGKERKVGWVGTTVIFFFVKKSLVKRKWEMVRCHNATAISFIDKVLGEVFAHVHAVAIKRHSSMQN